MKALKIVGSILLVLVLVAGTYVGVITKGFIKWNNLKSEKNKVVEFFKYGKYGKDSDLLDKVKELEETNKILNEDKSALSDSVNNLTNENTILTSDVERLTQENHNLNEEKNKYLSTDYYIQFRGLRYRFNLSNGSYFPVYTDNNYKTKCSSSLFMRSYNLLQNYERDVKFCEVHEIYSIKSISDDSFSTTTSYEKNINYANTFELMDLSLSFDSSVTDEEQTAFLAGTDTREIWYYTCNVNTVEINGQVAMYINFEFCIEKI